MLQTILFGEMRQTVCTAGIDRQCLIKVVVQTNFSTALGNAIVHLLELLYGNALLLGHGFR